MKEGREDEEASSEELPDVLHDLKNCLSVIRSGCLLSEDALGRGATSEVQPLIDAMKDSTGEALKLIRSIQGLLGDK